MDELELAVELLTALHPIGIARGGGRVACVDLDECGAIEGRDGVLRHGPRCRMLILGLVDPEELIG